MSDRPKFKSAPATVERAFDIYSNFLASTPGILQGCVRTMNADGVIGEPSDGALVAKKKELRAAARAAKLAAEAFDDEVG